MTRANESHGTPGRCDRARSQCPPRRPIYASLKLTVVGHTDAKGTDDYNLDLSRRRASNVSSALVADYAIDWTRLQSRGAGAGEPVASNDDEEGRAKNRRVELVKR